MTKEDFVKYAKGCMGITPILVPKRMARYSRSLLESGPTFQLTLGGDEVTAVQPRRAGVTVSRKEGLIAGWGPHGYCFFAGPIDVEGGVKMALVVDRDLTAKTIKSALTKIWRLSRQGRFPQALKALEGLFEMLSALASASEGASE